LDKITPIKKIYEFLNKSNKITINDLGYLLGPILNAGGRLGFSSYAVKLLSSNDEKEIDLIIKKLVELNEKRKSFEETILNNIDYKRIEFENENVIIYYHPSINEGLIGIIAARLKDIFNKPAIVITSSQNLLKGSARSISGFDIGLVFKNALDNKLITKGGGHKMAAGFSLDKNNLKSFRKFIDNSYKKMCKNLNSNFLYESKISTSVFNSNFNVEINKLYPFGQGNTEPVFLFENLKIIKSKVLNNKHISNIFVSKSGFSIKSIAFNSINEAIGNYLLNYKKEINVIGYLNDNFWNNKKTLQLVVSDLII
jgi:single-stranded-DNA-specific exonuclease